MLNVKVRSFQREDLRQVSLIERACFRKPYPPSLLLLLARLNPQLFLVAEASGKIVGYVSALPDSREVAHLVSLAVHPEVRRVGVARKLMEELLSKLRGMGFRELRLEVRIDNFPAISLYKALGFREGRKLRGYYEDGSDALTMSLKL